MFVSLFLLSLTHLSPAPVEDSLLATVPENAYVLVHCRDVKALRARAELNDWYRLLDSSQGEPLLDQLAGEFRDETHSEMDELLTMAAALEGEAVFFDTGTVAGFVTEPPTEREKLAGLVRDWMPEGDASARNTLDMAGGSVELVAWPKEIDGWAGRAGHYAAFVDHPKALAIYSGDDKEAVLAALTTGVKGLGTDRHASLVTSYLESGGGETAGIELFIDFTPLVDEAEAALKQSVEGVLPDPTSLLGLEGGTWLHASADVYPGTLIDCRAKLRLPPDTLVAELADTFKPLPRSLPADLPQSVWGLYALNWDLKLFYQRARAAYEEANLGDGLAVVDVGIEAARGMAGVDLIGDVLNQFAGDFALYFVEPEEVEEGSSRDTKELQTLGIYAGLRDGDAFMNAFEKLITVGGLESIFTVEEIAGVDAYLSTEDEDFDGGIAFLPRAFSAAPTRHVLEAGLKALTRAKDASVTYGSLMRAAIDENTGACFLSCVEMTPLRAFLLPELQGGLSLPPLEEGQPARDPFDSQLIGKVRRTSDGFELRLHTR